MQTRQCEKFTKTKLQFGSLSKRSRVCKAESDEDFLVDRLEQFAIRGRQGRLRHHREVRVEVADIAWRFNGRFEGRSNFAILQLCPIHVSEEGVLPDESVWRRWRAESQGGISFQQLRETGRCFWRNISWIERSILADGSEEIILIVALKRRLADEHLVEKNTQ